MVQLFKNFGRIIPFCFPNKTFALKIACKTFQAVESKREYSDKNEDY